MPEAPLPLIVEPEALEDALGSDGLLVVDVSEPAAHAQQHVPGAVHLPYAALIGPRPPALGLIAPPERLSEAFSAIGLTPETHVVAYDNEGNGRAARLLWTLDVIGHARFSLLNGGMHAWVREGHPTETGLQPPAPGRYHATPAQGGIADKAYVRDHLNDPGVVILDVRSPAEFAGEDVRAARAGHIPGAVNMDWTLAMDRARNLRIRPAAELRALLEGLGVTPDKEVIAHCQTHHRSAHTYIVLKSLDYRRVRGYDGSWSEWGNDPDLPIES